MPKLANAAIAAQHLPLNALVLSNLASDFVYFLGEKRRLGLGIRCGDFGRLGADVLGLLVCGGFVYVNAKIAPHHLPKSARLNVFSG